MRSHRGVMDAPHFCFLSIEVLSGVNNKILQNIGQVVAGVGLGNRIQQSIDHLDQLVVVGINKLVAG